MVEGAGTGGVSCFQGLVMSFCGSAWSVMWSSAPSDTIREVGGMIVGDGCVGLAVLVVLGCFEFFCLSAFLSSAMSGPI